VRPTDAPEWCWVLPDDRRRTVPYGVILALIPPVSFLLGFAAVVITH
jgi:hypothetical protein